VPHVKSQDAYMPPVALSRSVGSGGWEQAVDSRLWELGGGPGGGPPCRGDPKQRRCVDPSS
jgi:hypothetical protein